MQSMTSTAEPTLRTDLRPGDLGTIVHQHGVFHSRECGFDATFDAYVAGPLAEFVRHPSPRQRLWMAEQQGQIVGTIAIVPGENDLAQLRWFLVHPQARGAGLGTRLLHEAISFAQACNYPGIYLWTVSNLTTAAYLYTTVGFHLTVERPLRLWGVEVIEQRYDCDLGPKRSASPGASPTPGAPAGNS